MPNKTVTLRSEAVVNWPRDTKILEAKLNSGIQAVIEYDKANENILEQREFILGFNGFTPPDNSVVAVMVRNHAGTHLPLFEINPKQGN
jgi:hypothetical protein